MTISRNGSGHNNANAASVVTSITTTGAGRVFVFITSNASSISSVSGGSLTWNVRQSKVGSGIWEYYADSAGALTAVDITVTLPASAFTTVDIVGYEGSAGSIVFDTNASLPATAATGEVTLSTDATNTTIIGATRATSDSTPSAGSGWTLISGANYQGVEERAFTSAQSSLTVPWTIGSGSLNGAIGDAITESGGSGATASGTPAAQSSSVSGAGDRTAKASGTIGAQAASVSGAALRAAFASGAVAAQLAAITAAASREAKASGTPAAQASSVSGSASGETPVASGAIAAQGAEIFGDVAYQPQGADFDGTNDYLTRGADLTGNADTQQMTWSFWFRSSSGSLGAIYRNDDSSVGVSLMATGALRIFGFDAGFTTGFQADTSTGYNDGSWHHCCGSVDSSSASLRHCYVDDISDVTWTFYDTAGNFNAAEANHAVGATTSGGSKYTGDLADFYCDFGAYIDLSVTANRRKFIGSGASTPVDLGSDGSTPTSSAPLMFFHGSIATWHTNDGSGGGFTENGALTASSADPPPLYGAAMAAITRKAQGTPAAQDATISGSAVAGSIIASGAIQAAAAAASGAASRTAKASGAVQSAAASVAGSAIRAIAGISGAISAGAASVTMTFRRLWYEQTGPGETWTSADSGDEETWYEDTPGGGETWL